jgi:hypothetical protein
MNRIQYVCLAALALAARLQLEAQSLQAQLGVNLGPIAIDWYNGTTANDFSGVTSGPNIPACSYGGSSNYRACIVSILNSYNQ